MLTTTKLMVCLAGLSTMGYEGSAEIADPNNASKLSKTATTTSAIQKVQAADSAFAKIDEERTPPLPRPLRVSRPLDVKRANRIPVAPYTDQAKLKGLQRASASARSKKTEDTQKRSYSKWTNDEEMVATVMELVLQECTPFKILQKMTDPDIHSEDQIERVRNAIKEGLDTYKIMLQKETTKWRREGKDPDEVHQLLGAPKPKSVKYSVYIDYRAAFNDLKVRVLSKYDKWCSDNAHPDDVLKDLQKEYPDDGKMIDKFHTDYKNLYEGYSGDMGKLKTQQQQRKIMYADLEALATLLKDMMEWRRQGKTPEEVHQLLGVPNLKSLKYKVFMDYRKSFRDRESHVRSKYAGWLIEETHPADILKKLELAFPGEEQMNFRYHDEYKHLYEELPSDWEKFKTWVKPGERSYSNIQRLIRLQKKMTEWRREGKTPEEVNQLLGVPNHNSLKYKFLRDYKEKFAIRKSQVRSEYIKWLIEGTHPADILKKLELQFPGEGEMLTKFSNECEKLYEGHFHYVEHLRNWFNDGKTPDDVLNALLALQQKEELLSLSGDMVILLHELYKNWWTKERTLEGWMQQAKRPKDVYALLRLDRLDSSKQAESKDYQSYLQYTDWWIDTYPEEALAEWMEEEKAPREVFVLLKLHLVKASEWTAHRMYPYFRRYVDWWFDML